MEIRRREGVEKHEGKEQKEGQEQTSNYKRIISPDEEKRG